MASLGNYPPITGGLSRSGRGLAVWHRKATRGLKVLLCDCLNIFSITILGYKCFSLAPWNAHELVCPRHKKQEPMAINDPVTKELLVNQEAIKSASLLHNIKILTKNKPLIEDLDRIKQKEEQAGAELCQAKHSSS